MPKPSRLSAVLAVLGCSSEELLYFRARHYEARHDLATGKGIAVGQSPISVGDGRSPPPAVPKTGFADCGLGCERRRGEARAVVRLVRAGVGPVFVLGIVDDVEVQVQRTSSDGARGIYGFTVTSGRSEEPSFSPAWTSCWPKIGRRDEQHTATTPANERRTACAFSSRSGTFRKTLCFATERSRADVGMDLTGGFAHASSSVWRRSRIVVAGDFRSGQRRRPAGRS